jgi:hypothetical protein
MTKTDNLKKVAQDIIVAIHDQTNIQAIIYDNEPLVCYSIEGDLLFEGDAENNVTLFDAFQDWCSTAPHKDGKPGIAPF